MIIPLIDKLRQEHRLSTEEYKALLLCQDADTLKVSAGAGTGGVT